MCCSMILANGDSYGLETLIIQSLRKGHHVAQKVTRPRKQGYGFRITQARWNVGSHALTGQVTMIDSDVVNV